MRVAPFVALALAAYSVFLVATIPATFVGAQLREQLRGRVEISDAQGTLWRGNARVQIARGPVIDRVQWRFLPSRLFAGETAFEAQLASPAITGALQIARAFRGWRIRDVGLGSEASALAPFLPIVSHWRPGGPIRIDAREIVIEGSEIRGELSAQWRDAATTLSEVRPLGSYAATWRGGRVTLTTAKGPLHIAGSGTFTPPTRLAFSGEARAEASHAKTLEPLLDLMGPRRPDGSRALELRMN